MRTYDENMIKIRYCDQCMYGLFDPSDNEDEDVGSLDEILDDDDNDDGDGDGDDDVMRPPVLEFGRDTRVDDMVCNNWSIYHKKSIGSGDLVVG